MISIAELEHIVDFDTRPGVTLSGHADLEAYGKAREALPVLLEVVKVALEWQRTRHAPRGDRQADATEAAFLSALAKVRM